MKFYVTTEVDYYRNFLKIMKVTEPIDSYGKEQEKAYIFCDSGYVRKEIRDESEPLIIKVEDSVIGNGVYIMRNNLGDSPNVAVWYRFDETIS